MARVFQHQNWKRYSERHCSSAPGNLSLFNAASAQGRWFTEAGVFIGLDSTLKQSPQCQVNAVDNRGTSNLGMFVNIWQSQSDRLQVNFKYTHHSCALGADRNAYDAFGVELRWVLWKR